jgi:hypothetical protein
MIFGTKNGQRTWIKRKTVSEVDGSGNNQELKSKNKFHECYKGSEVTMTSTKVLIIYPLHNYGDLY